MKRSAWSAALGVGVAGLLLAGPAARAGDDAKKGSTASGQMGHEPSATSSEKGTGAQPGEATGAPSATERSTRESHAAAGTNELWGKVDKYDREKRELSLAGSDEKLKVTDDTEIRKDGSKVSPGQIMEGDDVRASFSGTGEILILEIAPAMPETGAKGSSGAATPPATGGTDTTAGGSSTSSSGSAETETSK